MHNDNSVGSATAKADLTDLFDRLARSAFRRKFRLREPELGYLRQKGLDVIMAHAAEFIAKRLAPAYPHNDGKQTPYRHHPVFVAQHATATCCRGCLAQWHHIEQGKPLTTDDQQHILRVLRHWLVLQDPDRIAEQKHPPDFQI